MNQLKSIYNSPLKDSHSHLIHTCFPMIASNVSVLDDQPRHLPIVGARNKDDSDDNHNKKVFQ